MTRLTIGGDWRDQLDSLEGRPLLQGERLCLTFPDGTTQVRTVHLEVSKCQEQAGAYAGPPSEDGTRLWPDFGWDEQRSGPRFHWMSTHSQAFVRVPLYGAYLKMRVMNLPCSVKVERCL